MLRNSCFGLLIALALVTSFFYKAIFLSKPITKLGNLQFLDAMHDFALKQAFVPIKFDPSGILIFFPNGHFEGSMWSQFVAPIWNPLVGCGFPLLGDPQSFIHSPAHLIQIFSSPSAYNFGLMLEIFLGVLGTYFCARYLKLSIWGAVISTLAFVLSPRILAQIDIGGNECFFPWLYLAFLWLSSKPSYLRAAIVGAICAIVAMSAHPETTFFAVLFSGFLSFFILLTSYSFDQKAADEQKIFVKNFIIHSVKSMSYLLLAAIVSILVSLPLVIPFLEFMQHAHLYKDDGVIVPIVSFTELFAGLFCCRGAEPFFIGAPALLLVPLSLLTRNRYILSIWLTIILSLIICVPLGPIYDLCRTKPFSNIATLYGVPDLLFLLSICAGFGFDQILFVSKLKIRKFSELWGAVLENKTFILLLLSSALVALYPIFLIVGENSQLNFMQVLQMNNSMLKMTSFIGLLASLACFTYIFTPSLDKRLLGLVFVVGLFSSLALAGKSILPNCPKFSLEATKPVKFLIENPGRSLATENNFYLPNTNLDYATEDFRCFSPLLLKRYVDFIKLCGAHNHNLYFYDFPDFQSRLIDLAGVKYVLTRQAIAASMDAFVNLKKIEFNSLRLLPGLRILGSSINESVDKSNNISSEVYYDRENSQINMDLGLKIQDTCQNRYSLQFCVFDKLGNEIWSGPAKIIESVSAANSFQAKHFAKFKIAIPVPLSLKHEAHLAIRVLDTWTSQVVKPEITKKECGDAHSFLKITHQLVNSSKAKQYLSHFTLEKEFFPEQMRIYKNNLAMPFAYAMPFENTIFVDREEEALQKISDAEFNPRQNLVIEANLATRKMVLQEDKANREESRNYELVNFKRINCNKIEMDTYVNFNSFLVLTECNYPGWKCYIDAKESQVFQANYLFKAVYITAGKHKICFSFEPRSYIIALAVSVITILIIVIFAFNHLIQLIKAGTFSRYKELS